MRIVAFSDSHGNPAQLREAAETALRVGPADIVVHCGDGVRDLAAAEPLFRAVNPNVRFYAVRGNGDMSAFFVPTLELFEAEGVRMLATHGHLYDVKTHLGALLSAAESHKASVVFFGHTHRPLLDEAHGVTLINPGAVCSRLPGNIAYASVTVDARGRLRADLMPWLT